MKEVEFLHQKSNSDKSKSGADLNRKIEKLLMELEASKCIKKYKKEPSFSYEKGGYKQFRPDFLIETYKEIILIDNTSTLRSDRVKQKQWDANGCKHFFKKSNIPIRYFVIVPGENEIGNEKTREKEIAHYRKEKEKIFMKDYHSQIDDILTIEELSVLLKENGTEQ